MTRLSEDTKYQKERLRVLVTLGAQEKSSPGDCPSDEQLAAFTDGRLENGEREKMLAHLNACPSCYRQWLDISFLLPADTESLKEPHPSSDPKSPPLRGVRGVFRHGTQQDLGRTPPCAPLKGGFFNQMKPSVWWGRLSFIFPLTAVACLFLFMIAPISLETEIGRSYESALGRKLSFKAEKRAQAFGLPWEEPGSHLAFGASKRHEPEHRAFGAGLWSGRQEFSETPGTWPMPEILSPTETENWSETRYGIYFSMGRWFFLLRAVCLADETFSRNFWEGQRELSDRIWKDFASTAKDGAVQIRIVGERLENIRSVLRESDQGAPSGKQRRKLAREVAMIMDHLSPFSL